MELGVDLGAQYHNSVLTEGHPETTIQTPKDAATVLFRFLHRNIEAFVTANNLPSEIKYSISIPASFEPNQRQDLTDALQAAGIDLPSQAFIDEPNAAFLSHLTEVNTGGVGNLQIPSVRPLHILVFDFGAGTCDISILEVGEAAGSFYSKNLAISRFEVLGGDNIDRQIVRDVLIDQACDQSGIDEESLRHTEVEKRIVPSLKTIAEQLKIKVSKRVGREKRGRSLPGIASSKEYVELDSIEVETRLMRDTMRLSGPRLSCREFQDVLEAFLDASGQGGAHDDEISIFKPIRSALRKAEIDAVDLDMILLIGGSSENPYVQTALQSEFEHVEVVIPQDLRAHVSTGAAINSLLLNGFGLNMITPITSETIYVITRSGTDESLYPVVRAGVEIPSPATKVDALRVGRDGQTSVQLPVCVGSRNKILGTLEVKAPTEEGFERGTPIHLSMSITEDKLLRVSAEIGGRDAQAKFIHPVSNLELTPEERTVREAEKAVHNVAAERGGRPSVPALLELVRACGQAGDHMRAAEILEQVQMMDDSERHETSITYHYSHAGRHDLALEWAEKAFEREQKAINAYNLALLVHRQEYDDERYEELMQQAVHLDGSYVPALVSLGSHIKRKGEDDRAKELLERAFDILQPRRSSRFFSDQDARNLKIASKHLGREEIAQEMKERIDNAASSKSSSSELYRRDQLAEQRQIDELEQQSQYLE